MDLEPSIFSSLSRSIALLLWQMQSIKVNVSEPFVLRSGLRSPIYVNCRDLISSPLFADLFGVMARMIIERRQIQFDIVGGGETAGIPMAAFLARTFGKPMLYVRKESKGYGTKSRIEGRCPEGSRVLLVEDLITDAGSKLSFIEALRGAGAIVEDVLVVFDRQQNGAGALKNINVRLHSACDMEKMLEIGGSEAGLHPTDLRNVRRYLSDPAKWHADYIAAHPEPAAAAAPSATAQG